MGKPTSLLALLAAILVVQSKAVASATGCQTYSSSGPIVVTTDNQIIENKVITSINGPAINTNLHSGVIIRNVVIHHNRGPGVYVNNSNSVSISGADIIFDGAPSTGPNPSDAYDNIYCEVSPNLNVTNVRLTRGSSGVYLENCPNNALSFIEGHDQRGPEPRGQLVQWNSSDNGSLTDFSNVASLSTSWTEDNVNVYHSQGITIARGLLDGNNSPSGDGILVDELSGNVQVTDVDAIHQGNGCFGIYGGSGHDVTFRRTRCRDNYCSLPRGTPQSNSLAWAIDPQSIKGNLNIVDSYYANLCNPYNIVWESSMLSVMQLAQSSFTPRPPFVAQLCQSGGSSLFLASDVPAFVNVTDTNSFELGVKFTSSIAGNITGFRFYKGSQDTGTHIAHLWSATGTLLASATFVGETASGWQQVNLPTPVAIAANTTYVASYHTSGHYSGNGNYFATAHTNEPLTAPDSASSGGNGVYAYGSAAVFPSNTYIAANFWVDVVFQ
jgi:hypothetical protein